MPITQIIYASRPFGFDAALLAGILMDARRCNARDGITGALICRDDLFLQLLEGPEEEVEAAENNLELIKEGQTTRGSQATNTLVRSTVEGMILDVPVEVGNSVIESNTFNDGTTVAVIADMGDMIFEGQIDETEVGLVRKLFQAHVERTKPDLEEWQKSSRSSP